MNHRQRKVAYQTRYLQRLPNNNVLQQRALQLGDHTVITLPLLIGVLTMQMSLLQFSKSTDIEKVNTITQSLTNKRKELHERLRQYLSKRERRLFERS